MVRPRIALYLIFAASIAAVLFAGSRVQPGNDLITHEWGTFTSVAGADGAAVKWAPLSGPADLPCIVMRLPGADNPKYRAGLIRMETPVLYFYTQRPQTVQVRVDFPQGWMSEWYPERRPREWARMTLSQAAGYGNDRIEWGPVEIVPGATPVLPTGKQPSHYYAARETDAAPLRVGQQWEKLIFYRGVGDFEPPVRPVFTGERTLRVENSSREPIPVALVFENRGGKVGYRVLRNLERTVEIEMPELTGNREGLHRELAGHLIAAGLFEKEALAMIETWRDSWFEEGSRVFYIMPRRQVDAALPLTVTPEPAGIARVFVGRVEVLAPWLKSEIAGAVTPQDWKALARFGRFLEPFAAQAGRPFAGNGQLRPASSGARCVE
jgi:hypothetical protein